MSDSRQSRWEDLDTRLKGEKNPYGPEKSHAEKFEVEIVERDVPPRLITIPHSSMNPSGIFTTIRARTLQNELIIQTLQAQQRAQLETLKYKISKAVLAANAHADLLTKEYLTKLDEQWMLIFQKYEIRHLTIKSAMMTEVTARIVETIEMVQSQDWPEDLIHRTIDSLLQLRENVITKVMRELGT